jgi:hypothetical protein
VDLILAGIDARARHDPELVAHLAPRFVVRAGSESDAVVLVIQFEGAVGAGRVEYHATREALSGMVNTDDRARAVPRSCVDCAAQPLETRRYCLAPATVRAIECGGASAPMVKF